MTKFFKSVKMYHLCLAAALTFASQLSMAQFSGGRLSASPNPCVANSNGLCTAYISVSSNDPNQSFAISVESRSGGGEKLFACNLGSGVNSAPWISSDALIFRLYETSNCSAYNWRGRLIDSTVVTNIPYNPNNPPPPRRPDMVLQLNIDDIWDLSIQGNNVQYTIVQGGPGVTNTRVSGSLPRSEIHVSASATSSAFLRSPEVTILQQPSRYNDYILKLRVREPAGGRRDVSVNLFFN